MILSRIVTSGHISRASPAHYVCLPNFQATVGNGATLARQVYPFAARGKLVDVIALQSTAGNGTSWSLDVRNAAGTSLLTTVGVLTAAAGLVGIDIKGEMSLPAGCTRPVVKTDGTEILSKGDYFYAYTAETGSYTTHAVIHLMYVFEPLQ